MKKIKIAYIGGGSKMWARIFMNDLALVKNFTGEIALYDIDIEAAHRNKQIGEIINEAQGAINKWNYQVYQDLDQALNKADFVIISILPGTFKEMDSDVHAPEEYGIYQAVGDTTGPGGILRAMRTIPIYEHFAQRIKVCCPTAWVFNLTNPMNICTKALYDIFPEIKALGCCHEVFHAQDLLALVVEEELGLSEITRKDIDIQVSGINHFTWISKAFYKSIDVLKILPNFIERYYNSGIFERPGQPRDKFKYDPFAYGNKVKFDLFNRYKILAAAGDRHLAEFFNNAWYIANPQQVKKWFYNLTTVDHRIKLQEQRIKNSLTIIKEKKVPDLKKSDEEVVDMIEALLGFNDMITNINMPNIGQIKELPLGSIVETNCRLTQNTILPIETESLPIAVQDLVIRNLLNVETAYLGIKERNLEMIFSAFINDPLSSILNLEDGRSLFNKMIIATKEYLEPYYDLSPLLNK